MASKVRPGLQRLSISDSKDKLIDSFYPLRMTMDKKTEMYVKFAKVMIIFQGPVTAERTRAGAELASKFKYAARIISDKTYEEETSRCSSEGGLDDFYRYFKSRVKKCCEEGYNLIIIDQSITHIRQMNYYYYAAQKMQYVILPYPPLVDANVSDNTKTKAEKFQNFSRCKVDRPNYFRHLFCGWFLHDIDSHELREEANLYIQDCFDSIPDFRDMFTKIWSDNNCIQYYKMEDKRQDLAFCAMKIFQNPLDVKGYMSENIFKKYYGGMSKLYIVGFIISPHIIAARVKLTYDQKKLWEMPDEVDDKNKPSQFPSELLKSTKVFLSEEKITLIASKSNRTIITGDPINEPTEVIHPRAKGKACHIVLGKSKNAPPLNVDYDVQLALLRERNVTQKYSDDIRPYDLDRSLARRIGKYWFIYLKETLIINGLFSSCCGIESN